MTAQAFSGLRREIFDAQIEIRRLDDKLRNLCGDGCRSSDSSESVELMGYRVTDYVS